MAFTFSAFVSNVDGEFDGMAQVEVVGEASSGGGGRGVEGDGEFEFRLITVEDL